MGHNISIKGGDGSPEAELNYGAFYEANRTIYDALIAHEAYGGVSGKGREIVYTKQQILFALHYITSIAHTSDYEYYEEVIFLGKCLRMLVNNDTVTIKFY